MHSWKRFISGLLIFGAPFFIVGCQDDAEDAAEEAADTIEDAADDAADGVEDAAEEVDQSM